MQISTLIGSAIVAAVAVMVWFVMKIRFVDQRVVEAKRKVEEIREAAQQDAERLKKEKLVEAKDEIFTWRSEAEKELHEGRRKFNKWERNLSRQEDNLQSKEQEILRNEKDSNRRLTKLQHRERGLAEGERNLEEVRAEHIKRLEAVAGLTAEEANAFLKKYLRTYNQKFRVTPANNADVHVKPERHFNLDQSLCKRTKRTVRNDNTIAHNSKLYQIRERVLSRKVIVEERVNGSLHICRDGVSLKYKEITKRPKKVTESRSDRASRPVRVPPRDHPWRRSGYLTSVEQKKITQLTE